MFESKKMGRPEKDYKKNTYFKLRMDGFEQHQLKTLSKHLNISKSDVIREALDHLYGEIFTDYRSKIRRF